MGRPPKNTPSSPASTDCPAHSSHGHRISCPERARFPEAAARLPEQQEAGRKDQEAGKGGRRWVKDVGLGFKTPRTAIEGNYIDKKCPFTGLVSIRGRILTGTVVSTKMHRTLVIRREYLHFIPKYSRYER